VHLIANQTNSGFSTACNQALALARGRYLLLLNPDTIVPPGALARLVEVADQHPEAGIIGPTIRPVNGKSYASFCPFPSWESAFRHYTLAKPLLRLLPRSSWRPISDRPTTSGMVSGACLLIRRVVFEQIGGLDERYFLFYEDFDYCRRAVREGWKILFTQRTFVFHHWGKSTAQEHQSWVGFRSIEGLLRYLEGEHPRGSRFLKPLFKLCFLGWVVFQLVASGAKTLGYRMMTKRAGKVAKHRSQFERDAIFLRRFTGKFLRL